MSCWVADGFLPEGEIEIPYIPSLAGAKSPLVVLLDFPQLNRIPLAPGRVHIRINGWGVPQKTPRMCNWRWHVQSNDRAHMKHMMDQILAEDGWSSVRSAAIDEPGPIWVRTGSSSSWYQVASSWGDVDPLQLHQPMSLLGSSWLNGINESGYSQNWALSGAIIPASAVCIYRKEVTKSNLTRSHIFLLARSLDKSNSSSPLDVDAYMHIYEV